MRLYKKMADSHPKLRSGLVYCERCKCVQKVNADEALRSGWPKCCDETMTMDVHEEKER